MQDPNSNLAPSVALPNTKPVHMGIFEHWPNRITAMRFIGSLVLFALFAVQGREAFVEQGLFINLVFWLFVLNCASDALDGYIARAQNVVTAFGRIADPFCDKVLILGTMIFLSNADWSRDMFPAWMVVLILAREFLVTGIRGYIESIGKEFPADGFGKAKMILQCIWIGAALGAPAFPWPEALREVLVQGTYVLGWLTVLATIGSGLQYVLKTKKILAST